MMNSIWSHPDMKRRYNLEKRGSHYLLKRPLMFQDWRNREDTGKMFPTGTICIGAPMVYRVNELSLMIFNPKDRADWVRSVAYIPKDAVRKLTPLELLAAQSE